MNNVRRALERVRGVERVEFMDGEDSFAVDYTGGGETRQRIAAAILGSVTFRPVRRVLGELGKKVGKGPPG